MLKKCRDCVYWIDIPPWQGNCKLYPTEKPQWRQSASPCVRGCTSYTDKYETLYAQHLAK